MSKVSSGDDRVDQLGDSPVHFHFEFRADGVLMGRSGVTKYP